MNNKMLMIDGQRHNNICEVFDIFTRTFTLVKIYFNFAKNVYQNIIVSVGNIIYFFKKENKNNVKVYSYDVENNDFRLKHV